MDANERFTLYLPWNWRQEIGMSVFVARTLESAAILAICLMSGLDCLAPIGLAQFGLAIAINMGTLARPSK